MTLSIIAKDKKTGELGGVVVTNWFGCSNVLKAKAGVGIIASQGMVNNSYTFEGLNLLDKNKKPKEVVNDLISSDDDLKFRQLAVLNNNGEYHQFHGDKCIEYVSIYNGDGFCVQSNLMKEPKVAEIVGKEFEKNVDLPLEERLVLSLIDGERYGADIRGSQTCSLITSSGDKQEEWNNYDLNFSIEDHENPLNELYRIIKMKNSYDLLKEAIDNTYNSNFDKAENIFFNIEKDLNNDEVKFWRAIFFIESGDMKKGDDIIFNLGKNWKELYKRLS